MISLLEGHRSLYGGYVGVNSPSGIRAFVNLRSMNFNHKGGYCLYAGGGITSLSQPSDEWLETEAKSGCPAPVHIGSYHKSIICISESGL